MVKKYMGKNKKRCFLFPIFYGKKGQVRGIDFALGMLIFILVFSQIILVLSSLLFPSLLQLESYSKEEDLKKVYDAVFYSPGEPSNWGTIPTSSLTNFRMGLALNENNELDFTKINRLVPDVSDYWKIDYLTAKISFSLTRDFAIDINSPIEIYLTSVTIAFGTITIKGKVQYFEENLAGAKIWAFALDTSNNIAINTTETKKLNSDIGFISTLTLNSSLHYSIAVFAEFGLFQTYKVLRMSRVSGSLDYSISDFAFRPFAKSYTDLPSTIEVMSPRSPQSDEAEAFVLFPFKNSDMKYYHHVLEKKNTEEGDIYYTTMSVPAKGFAVLIIQERIGDTYQAGYIGLPMLLSLDREGIFGPVGKSITSSAISLSHFLFVRGVLIRCRMWYW